MILIYVPIESVQTELLSLHKKHISFNNAY
jgi:hypothetical protein